MFGAAKVKKTKSVIHPIKCTLEDLYQGKKIRIKVTRDRNCIPCNGKGTHNAANNQKCEVCSGSGQIKQMRMMGPGNMREVSVVCDLCNGTGETIPESGRCQTCKGKRIQKEKKVIECKVDRGAPDGEKYFFHGEADEHPEKEAGDVVFIVAQQKHDVFKRRGADLLMTKEISI